MSTNELNLDEELEPAGAEHDEIESAEEAELLARKLEERIPRVNFGQPSEHKLARSWSFWFNRRNFQSRSASASADTWVKGVRKISSFNTAEGFWSAYSHLTRPNELPTPCDLSFFKDPITPAWEDDANKEGGKWIIRLRKGFTSKYWEDLVLALIGEQFSEDGICGAVISPRYFEDIISLWNSNSHDSDAKARILQDIRRILRIPPSISVEYKAHDQSIRDGSSFRNTNIVRGSTRSTGDRRAADDQQPPGTVKEDEKRPPRWGDSRGPAARRWVQPAARRETSGDPTEGGDWKEPRWEMPIDE